MPNYLSPKVSSAKVCLQSGIECQLYDYQGLTLHRKANHCLDNIVAITASFCAAAVLHLVIECWSPRCRPLLPRQRPPSHLSEYAGDSEHFHNALIYIDSAKQDILHVFMILYTDQLLGFFTNDIILILLSFQFGLPVPSLIP